MSSGIFSPRPRGRGIFAMRQRPQPGSAGMAGILDDLLAAGSSVWQASPAGSLVSGGSGTAAKETTTGPVTTTGGAVTSGIYGRFANMIGVQTALRGAGFDPGALDGRWGPNTATALRQYIAAHGRAQAESIFGAALVQQALAMAPSTGGGTTGGGSAVTADVEQLLATASGMTQPATGLMAMVPSSMRGVVEHPAFVPVAAGVGLIGFALAWNKWGKKIGKKRGKK